MPERDPLTELIIGAAIEVRKRVGCGLLESAYHAFLCVELRKRDLMFQSQPTLPVVYDGHRVDLAYRPDLIVNDRVVVELKTVSAFLPVHQAQILTYLRLSGHSRRIVDERSCSSIQDRHQALYRVTALAHREHRWGHRCPHLCSLCVKAVTDSYCTRTSDLSHIDACSIHTNFAESCSKTRRCPRS